MSEELLKALMKLFALASDVDDITQQSRVIVENYLKQELNAELVPTYLKLYDKFIQEIHHGDLRQEEALGASNVKEVCGKINSVLEQKQKIVILIRLLEYILADENVSEHEFQFLLLTAKTFNIPVDEFETCLKFIESSPQAIPDLDSVLIIDSNETPSLKEAKHLYKVGVEGLISVLKFPSVNMFVLRYCGEGNLILNGQIIYKERAYILTVGSSLRGNNLSPIFYSDIISSFLVREEKEKIVFKATGLEYRFKTGNIGMQPFKMCEENGSLIGIMGGSGAGKSTLLNILNGNYLPDKGQVTINGINIYTEKDKIEGVIGYVSQDDLLIEELTVFQNLFYSSKLIFGKKTNEEITTLVMDLIESIGLKETSNLKVGGPMDKYISGGQRKRLNIALELVREPSLLFVDEPTSGLSSRDSQNIMDLLKELALKGKLIYVVIHQPSSDIFKMFDKLIILDVGGYVVYNGNPIEGIKYFKRAAHYANANQDDPSGNVNPEVIFNIIDQKVVDEYGNLTTNRKVSPEQWYKQYIKNIDNKVILTADPAQAPDVDFNLASVFSQFRTFVTRDVLSKLTNRQYLLINLLEAPVLALILSYFIRYYPFINSVDEYLFLENENIPVYLFISVVVSLFIGLTVAAEEIIRDQRIRKREQFLNLNRGAYLISKILIMFSISAIQTASFLAVGNTVLHVDGMFASYFMVLFSTACFANLLGLNISASFNSAVTIYILIPFIIIPQLLFSGVLVKFDKLNPSISSKTTAPFIGEVMASRWAFEALSVNQFINNKFERHLYAHDKILSMANFKKVYWIPELESKVSLVEKTYKDPDRKEETELTMKLIVNEINKQNKTYPKLAYQNMEEISSLENLSSEVFGNLRNFLRLQRTFYNKLYNHTLDDKDDVISHLRKSDEFDFGELKMKYRNNALTDLVTNKNEISKIETLGTRFIQLEDPIYRDGETFRSHFYSPRKKIFGKYFDTLWVNVLVIWSMTLMLIIALFFNAFRKFLDLFGK